GHSLAATMTGSGLQCFYGLALECDLARSGIGCLLVAMTAAQEQQQGVFILIGNGIIRLGMGQTRFFHLGKKPLHCNSNRLGEFTDCYICHLVTPDYSCCKPDLSFCPVARDPASWPQQRIIRTRAREPS